MPLLYEQKKSASGINLEGNFIIDNKRYVVKFNLAAPNGDKTLPFA